MRATTHVELLSLGPHVQAFKTAARVLSSSLLTAVRTALGATVPPTPVTVPLSAPWTRDEDDAGKLLSSLVAFMASPANAAVLADVPDCLPAGSLLPETGDAAVDARVLLLALAPPHAPPALIGLLNWQNRLRTMLVDLTGVRGTLAQVCALSDLRSEFLGWQHKRGGQATAPLPVSLLGV